MSDSERDPNPARARDHMANERTYLAWLRTGGGVMALGLAVAKFGETTPYTLGAGALLTVVGALGLVYGTWRYRRVNAEVEQGRYVTGSRGRGPVLASTVLIAAVLIALVLLLLGGSPRGDG